MNTGRDKQSVGEADTPAWREGDDLVADLFQTKPQRGPAGTAFRQYSAVNEFNPEGITLLGIRLGLHDTVYGQWERIARVQTSKCIDPKVAAHACPVVQTRMDGEPIPEHLVQPDDEDRARFIRDTPLALLSSIEHQDAVARWHYAELHGTPEVRRHAAGLLQRAVGRRRGRQQTHTTDPDALAQAYFDLVAYLWAVRRCVDKVGTAAELLSIFPDCEVALRILGTNAERQASHGEVRISPPTAALTILRQMVGLGRSQLQEMLKPYRARYRAS